MGTGCVSRRRGAGVGIVTGRGRENLLCHGERPREAPEMPSMSSTRAIGGGARSRGCHETREQVRQNVVWLGELEKVDVWPCQVGLRGLISGGAASKSCSWN